MKTKKKMIVVAAAIAVLAIAAIGGTMAYFSDTTETAENTFTMGKVEITLQEHDVTVEDGAFVQGDMLDEGEGVTYHLVPGQTAPKDPTVTVLADSEDCYVRVQVKLSDYATFQQIFAAHEDTTSTALDFFTVSDSWTADMDNAMIDDDGYGVVTFYYNEMVPSATIDTALTPVFTAVTLPSIFTNADAAQFPNGFTIEVFAEAIQAGTFADADAAWAAFDAEA